MKRHLKTLTLAIALSVTGLAGFAQSAPWERPRPANMTAAHEAQADAAITALRRVSPQKQGINTDMDWSWQGGQDRLQPVNNISSENYTRLLQGRYFVQRSLNRKSWNVSYFGPNGMVHTCSTRSGSGSRYEERVLYYWIRPSVVGFAGWLTQSEPQLKAGLEFSWPSVGNPSTGDLVNYVYVDSKWSPIDGFVQEEYAPIFAEKCPGMPRVSRVNSDQVAK